MAALSLSLVNSAIALPVSISSVSPAPASVVSNLSTITVLFSQAVTSVAPDDIFLNGTAATNVSGSGTTFTYAFPLTAEGSLQAVWNPVHAVRSVSTGNRLTDLDANTTWDYTHFDLAAPTTAEISPLPGSTVGQLSQISVTFNEAVAGVNATDLQINGQAAQSVTGTGFGPYIFQINASAPGTVQIAWINNHGIRDLAAAANPFAGGGWNYTFHPGEFAGNIVINEFLASNVSTNGLRDEDGDLEDWIELHNRGAVSVNLQGWSFSNDEDLEDEWIFPAVTLAPGQYFVVFASGKNRAPTNGAPLHTNFKLGSSGQFLALFNANFPREVATRFQPEYPAQQSDLAYGLVGGTFHYLTSATPGAANTGAATFSGIAEKPEASVKSGFFASPISVSLSSPSPQATIRYTFDGTEPTTTHGNLYSGSLTVAPSASAPVVNLRAVAFRDGLLCSSVATYSYVFPSSVLQQSATPVGFPSSWITPNGVTVVPADYEMDPQVLNSGSNAAVAFQALTNLPALSIVLGNAALFSQQSGIYANPNPVQSQRAAWERSASAELIFPDGSKGFRINAGLRIQGGTSRDPNRTRKHSLRLFFKSEYEGKLDFPVFEDSARTKFNTLVVDAGSNLTWHNRMDSLAYRAQYIRDQFASDLQLATGAPATHGRFVNVFLNGLYWGVCYIHERPDEHFSEAYLGGDKSEFDVVRNTEGALEIVNGDATAWNNMMSLVNSGLLNHAQYQQLSQYINIDRFIDYMIVNIWAGNTDWSMHNWYAMRRRGASEGFIFQVWDAEYTMKSLTENVSGYNHTGTPTGIHSFLRNNSEYRQRFADRLQQLCFDGGPLYVNTNSPAVNPASPMNNRPGALYMKRAAEVDLAMVLESARWGDAAPGRENNPFTRNVDFINELNWMKNTYLPGRTEVVLGQFRTQLLYPDTFGTPAPSFNQSGGNVPANFNLTITAPRGTIYYTTNGIDPRVAFTGAIASDALIYNGTPLVLQSSVTIKSRALTSGKWSPLTEATFAVAELLAPLRITELMYRPNGGGGYEYVELRNAGSTPVNLSGYNFKGITFSFPAGSTLQPGAVAVFAANASPASWTTRYPGVTPFGYYSGQLDNAGERVALEDALGRTIVSVTYSPTNGWPDTLSGRSIELIDINGNPDDPANWMLSGPVNGTPGTISPAPAVPMVRINELMANNVSAVANGGTFPDWIEIANTGSSAVNLSGWSLSDDSNARKYIFPSTSIPAGGFLTIFCDTQTTAPGLHTGFALDGNGETLVLYNSQTSRVDAVTFGAQVADLSLGRINSSWQLNNPTPNAANSPATTGGAAGLKINEWLANAVTGESDWFEIFNPTAERVELRGLYVATTEALFQITSPSFVGPGGYVRFLADEKSGGDHVNFKLPASGNSITLYDSAGEELDSVFYGQQTEGVSEGRFPNGSSTLMAFPASASPGAANALLSTTGLQLNEVLARNDGAVVDPWGGNADWIEIRNASATTLNLAGMSLSEGSANAGSWIFPSINLAAGGHLIVWCDSSRPAMTNAGSALNLGSSLSGQSGGIYLFNAAKQIVDFVSYGSQISNQSFGRSGGAWRLLSAPSAGSANSGVAALGNPFNLRLNEWMAAPATGADWFEIYNLDSLPVELTGLHLTDDPSIAGQNGFTIPSLSFAVGKGWATFIADDNTALGSDHVNFQLGASGETLRIYAADFSVIDSVSFGPQQTGASEGRIADGGANIFEFTATSTPGKANYFPLQSVAISEVVTHADPPLEDAIELVNLTAQPVDISGWYLSDLETALQKFQIPSGTILPAGGFKVFYNYQFNANPGVFPSFALDSAHGESLFLSQASAGNLTGQRASVTFDAAENGVSFGRFTNSTGIEFVAMSQRTFGVDNPGSLAQFRTGSGLPNATPKVGPIVISEMMYQPQGAGTNAEPVLEEFIELFNNSPAAVALYHPTATTNRWRFAGGVDFIFPNGVSMPAQSYLLVVSFDPATNAAALASFRSRFAVPVNVPIYGPFAGRLSNAGERIELHKPDAPQTSGSDAGFIPYILVEAIHYLPTSPWPVAAAGNGASLQRRNMTTFANDPLNWKGEQPTAGVASAQVSMAPVIIEQPDNVTASVGSAVSLEVMASGAASLEYRWQRDDVDLVEQTNNVLYLPNAQSSHSGSYRVIVNNDAGTVLSEPATLTVATPPAIVTNPISKSVAVGSDVTFIVNVSGTPSFDFQWYRGETPIAGENSSTLTIAGVEANDCGAYWVAVSNIVGSADSAPAQLSIIPLDSDGDGMPDAWEMTHNLNRFNAADASLDSDHDGMSNFDELLSGTDPQDAQSVLGIKAAGLDSTSRLRLTFTAIANIGYTVQWSSSLGTAWNNLTNIQPGSATQMVEINDPAAPGTLRLYRVVTPIQP